MKNSITINALLGLILSSTVSLGMQQVQQHKEFLAQQKQPSSWMYKLNKMLAPYITPDFPSTSANELDTKLWEKVQQDLQIPREYFIPIKKFEEKIDLKQTDCDNIVDGARTTPSAMYINPKLQKHVLGLQQLAFYHEGTHHKYLDTLNNYIKYRGILWTATTTTYLLGWYFGLRSGVRNIIVSNFLATGLGFSSYLATGHALNYLIWPYLLHTHERRADLEAAYAIKCHECINEVANHKKEWSTKDKMLNAKAGYLTSEELTAIAQEHQRKNNRCDTHKLIEQMKSNIRRNHNHHEVD